MQALALPVALSATFTGGCMAIRALNHRWADQVHEALGALFVMVCLLVVLALATHYLPSRDVNDPDNLSASAMSLSEVIVSQPALLSAD